MCLPFVLMPYTYTQREGHMWGVTCNIVSSALSKQKARATKQYYMQIFIFLMRLC